MPSSRAPAPPPARWTSARSTAPATPRSSARRRHRRLRAGQLHRHHGPVRLGQVDADALPRRARHARPRGQVFIGDADLSELDDKQLTAAAPRPASASSSRRSTWCRRSPRSRTSRCRCDLAGRKPDQALARPGGRHRRPRATGSSTARASSPAASSSASPWPGALASRPEIIFADEPTGNLDSRAGAEILAFLRQAVDELGQTIVMVTHDPVRRRLRRPRRVPRRRPHRRRDRATRPPSASSTA